MTKPFSSVIIGVMLASLASASNHLTTDAPGANKATSAKNKKGLIQCPILECPAVWK